MNKKHFLVLTACVFALLVFTNVNPMNYFVKVGSGVEGYCIVDDNGQIYVLNEELGLCTLYCDNNITVLADDDPSCGQTTVKTGDIIVVQRYSSILEIYPYILTDVRSLVVRSRSTDETRDIVRMYMENTGYKYIDSYIE